MERTLRSLIRAYRSDENGREVGCRVTYWLVDGNVIPDGWLKMDGQMHEVEHYPELARVLGRSHSWPGDPEGTFRVPDYR